MALQVYALAAMSVGVAVPGFFDPTFGLATNWLDLPASLWIGAAWLCLLNSKGARDGRWLAGLAVLASLAALSRYVAAAFALVAVGPVLAFYIAKLVDYVTRVYLRQFAAKTKTKLDDILVNLIDGPIKVIVFVILLHIGLQASRWPDIVHLYVGKAMIVAVALSLTYLALRFADLATLGWKQRAATDMDRV